MSLISRGGGGPKIGFGTYGLSSDLMENTIQTAIRLGYRLFDTASDYNNESLLGKALRNCIDIGMVKREELFIQTKYYPVSPYGYDDAIEKFDESIKRLDLDYIDAYLIHKPIPRYSENTYRTENKEVWKAFKELKKAGKIRYIGVSNFGERHIDFLDEGRESEFYPQINQLEIHPSYQQKGLREWCAERGMVIEGWSPLNRGKMLENPLIKELAEKYGKSPAQICISWAVQNGVIPITSAENEQWMRESIEASSFCLSKEDLDRFQSINSCDDHWDIWLYKRRDMY